MRAQLFHVGGRTDGQKDMTRFLVALRHMANAPRPAVPYSNSVRTWDCERVYFIGYNVSLVGSTLIHRYTGTRYVSFTKYALTNTFFTIPRTLQYFFLYLYSSMTKYETVVTHLRFYLFILPVVILRPHKESQKHHHSQLM